ncbi:response regulator [Haloprofundus salinisoli]|uniref:response regulator n=1 Tax=Haloprofundus salinisoli TaxID=2876193 RepID=UPI001CCC87E9|nr:response regulator [Haloprofundus salinisoli]
MSDYVIWWIDDTESRKEKHAEVLEEQMSNLSVIFTHPQKAAEKLNQNDHPDADLVLIDWMLNEQGEFLGKGLTMAGSVREHLQNTPIYGFTGGSLNELRTPASEHQFQSTLPLKDISSRAGAKNLEGDINDYQRVEAARGDGLKALLATLNPPEGLDEELKSLIPRTFSNGLKTDPTEEGGSSLEFADWVRHRFLKTPGPLLDCNWTATKLGVKPDYLDQYITELYETEYGEFTYDGIFHHRINPLWWTSELIEAVVDLAQSRDQTIGEIHAAAPNLLGVDDDHHSICTACGDPHPDTVAASIEGKDATYPVHFHCSNLHHSREGGFEDYRTAEDI